jgi:arylsulfatase
MRHPRLLRTRSFATARVLAIAAALALPGIASAASPLADGSVLPFPPTPSASVAKPTLQESTDQQLNAPIVLFDA